MWLTKYELMRTRLTAQRNLKTDWAEGGQDGDQELTSSICTMDLLICKTWLSTPSYQNIQVSFLIINYIFLITYQLSRKKYEFITRSLSSTDAIPLLHRRQVIFKMVKKYKSNNFLSDLLLPLPGHFLFLWP